LIAIRMEGGLWTPAWEEPLKLVLLLTILVARWYCHTSFQGGRSNSNMHACTKTHARTHARTHTRTHARTHAHARMHARTHAQPEINHPAPLPKMKISESRSPSNVYLINPQRLTDPISHPKKQKFREYNPAPLKIFSYSSQVSNIRKTIIFTI
jgi:uncharacterized protein YprB with RNaseH-like and TPR domain